MRPSERDIRIAAALILVAGLGATGLALLAGELGVGIRPEMYGWKRITLLAAGGLAVALGALLLARPRIGSWLVARSQRIGEHLEAPFDRYGRYVAIGLLAFLGIVLVWTRLIHIGESLWHDEAHSALTHNGITAAFGGHVLYHQLTWVTTNVLGESEALLRFWSVVPGIAAVGFGAWWAWRRIGAAAAVAFAALAVAAPLHLQHVPEARGYGLALLAATLMLIAADRLTRAFSRWTLLGFVAAGLVGIWTLVFFAFSFVGQVISLLWWPKLRVWAVAALAAGGLLSFLYHEQGPGYGQVGGELIPLSGAMLLERSLDWLVVPSAMLLTVAQRPSTLTGNLLAPEWASIALLALIAVAIVALWLRRDTGLALLLVLPPLAFNLAFSIGDLQTVPRHQIVLLPHVLLLVAIGIAELGRLVAKVPLLKPVAIATGVVGVLALSNAIVEEQQARALPRENFAEVANVVRGAGVDPVVTDSTRPTGLIYYLGDELAVLRPGEIESMLCERRRPMTYVHHPWPGPTASLECLVGTDSVRVRVPQRDRGYLIDVWIVNPRADRETIHGEDG